MFADMLMAHRMMMIILISQRRPDDCDENQNQIAPGRKNGGIAQV
jgi:hypothetical protein